MCEALAKGEKIPFDPTDATIYYVGPTPAKPGQVIGSAGPTTSHGVLDLLQRIYEDIPCHNHGARLRPLYPISKI